MSMNVSMDYLTIRRAGTTTKSRRLLSGRWRWLHFGGYGVVHLETVSSQHVSDSIGRRRSCVSLNRSRQDEKKFPSIAYLNLSHATRIGDLLSFLGLSIHCKMVYRNCIAARFNDSGGAILISSSNSSRLANNSSLARLLSLSLSRTKFRANVEKLESLMLK